MLHNPVIVAIGASFIAGIISIFFSDKHRNMPKTIATIVTTFSFAIIAELFVNPNVITSATANHLLITDHISRFAGLGITFFALIVTIYSLSFVERSCGKFFGYLLLTLSASLGAAFANNLILLLVCWGFLGAMLYLLVGMGETGGASQAAKRSLIIIGGTDALMLFGIGIIGHLGGTFAIDKLHMPLRDMLTYTAYFSIVVAACAKAGAVPFHSWLPEAAKEGPLPVTAYLPASLDKILGIYLLFRVSSGIFISNVSSNFILMLIGSVTIISAVISALIQHDMKKLLGYHAVSQVGYMVLGIGTGTVVGLMGGLFHMLNHAIYKTCLFLGAGNIEKSTGTTDLDSLGGLAAFMPVTFVTFLIASLSISGIPPLNGFVSKWMIYQGILETAGPKNHYWMIWIACAMFGSALTIASFMKLIHAAFLGRASSYDSHIKEAKPAMLIPVVVLSSLCVIFGIFAFSLPIKLFIAPCFDKSLSMIGMWNPAVATALLFAGIFCGLVIYWVSKKDNYRTVNTFIGGEDPNSMARLSGTDFYNTVKEVPFMKFIYARGEAFLDAYEWMKKIIYPSTGFLRKLHNGILPTYLVWCFLGMITVFVFLLFRLR